MFVKSIMKQKHKTKFVEKDALVGTALEILQSLQIDGMPVVDGNKYFGIITVNAIYEAFFHSGLSKESFLSSTKVNEIAKYNDDFVDVDEIFERTLVKVQDRPLVAVVSETGEYLGIITRFDVLEQFQSAFGMKRKGVRIAFTASEAEGRIAKLAEIAKQYHENIISLTTFDETDDLVRRIVMKVERQENVDKFVQKLEQSGFRILQIKED